MGKNNEIKSAPLAEVWQWADSHRDEWWEIQGVLTGDYPRKLTSHALVVKEGDEMVGVALLREEPPMIVSIFTPPPHRRRGIGRLLAEKAVETFSASGWRIIAEVCDSRALAMIESLPAVIKNRLTVVDVRRDA